MEKYKDYMKQNLKQMPKILMSANVDYTNRVGGFARGLAQAVFKFLDYQVY